MLKEGIIRLLKILKYKYMEEIKITPLETKKLILKKDNKSEEKDGIKIKEIRVPGKDGLHHGDDIIIKPLEKQAEEPREEKLNPENFLKI